MYGARVYFVRDDTLTFHLAPGPALVEPAFATSTDVNHGRTWSFCVGPRVPCPAFGSRDERIDLVHVEFTGRVIEWRGPSPFYFATVPTEQAVDIREVAALATYGWGAVPVDARIGRYRLHHVTLSQGRQLSVAAQERGPQAAGTLGR